MQRTAVLAQSYATILARDQVLPASQEAEPTPADAESNSTSGEFGKSSAHLQQLESSQEGNARVSETPYKSGVRSRPSEIVESSPLAGLMEP